MSHARRCLVFLSLVFFTACGGSGGGSGDGDLGAPAPGGPPVGSDGASDQTARLRIVNGCSAPLWVFYEIGFNGGSMGTPTPPHQQKLANAGDFVDFPIPDKGLAATRFWPGYGCDATGNNCEVGQSGGPAGDGFTCPANGCAPPVDSKFEGTFGCLSGTADCQANPSGSGVLSGNDYWDTSNVDGYTLPYKVEVLDSCPGGPANGTIDCSGLQLSDCPVSENLSTGGAYSALSSENLQLTNPATPESPVVGCYSPCTKLTFSNWGNAPVYSPSAPEAEYYCCPTPPVSAESCRAGWPANPPTQTAGSVSASKYVQLIHAKCPQVYGYAYDDGNGLWSCAAGTRYRVTFYCPTAVN